MSAATLIITRGSHPSPASAGAPHLHLRVFYQAFQLLQRCLRGQHQICAKAMLEGLHGMAAPRQHMTWRPRNGVKMRENRGSTNQPTVGLHGYIYIIYIYMCVCIFMCVCVSVCMYIYIYIYCTVLYLMMKYNILKYIQPRHNFTQ